MKTFSSTVLVLVLLFMATCVHEVPVDPAASAATTPTTPTPAPVVPTGKTCSADSVYFTNDILPLITSNCSMSTCHGGRYSPTLTTYTQISKNRSDISQEITKGSMPRPPVGLLTAAQIASFKKWVSQGYKNNSCTAGCDSTKFTFTAVIDPLMKKYCVGCHTGGTAANKNVDLSTYLGVKTVGLNGLLYKSVAHLPGASVMPPSGTALSKCEVAQIRKWVAAGALN
jgi:hypothetical protein